MEPGVDVEESMSEIDELPIDEDFEDDAPPSGKSSKMSAVIVAIVGLAGGGAFGLTTLGPTVGPMLADRASTSGEAGGGGGGHGAEAEEGASALHLIDNLVVNPAGSGGSRFLLTSVAVEVMDPAYTEVVFDHDFEMRAALIVLLGAKSVDELTDVSARAAMALEIERALVQILGPGIVRQIFIPQFVIQ